MPGQIQAYGQIIDRYATQFGVDAALVAAVIQVESNGDANSRSNAGAMGLMQLMPGTCQDFGVTDPYDPDQNIRGGTNLLARNLKRYGGDLKRALAAYNAGARRVDDGSWVNLSETRRYVPAVMGYYNSWSSGTAVWTPSEISPIPAQKPKPSQPVPTVNYLEYMGQVVKASQSINEPLGVVENGGLDIAADAMLADLASGKLSLADVSNKAFEYCVAAGFSGASAKAFFITTPNLSSLGAAWGSLPCTKGRLIGLSHSMNAGAHRWLVIVAVGP
jgi:hypothetical protein